jgi:hypothetical protein
MGQFYKGTEATFLDDAMFKLPYELMGTVIDKKDKEIQEDLDARNALSDLLKAQGLKPDEPRLQQIMKQYQDQIDTSVQDIYKDPLNYSREGVQRLKRAINEDFSLGEVAAIQGNRENFLAWEKEELEKIKKNPDLYSPDQFERLKAQKLAQFSQLGGTTYKGPNEYNTVETEDTIGIKDTVTVLDELMKGAVQDVNATVSWDNDRGGWNVKGKNVDKFFSPQMLEQTYKGFLNTNPEYVRGVAQRESLALAGWKDNFTPEGGLSFEPGSHFGDSMSLLKVKYGGKETVREGGKTLNEIGVQKEKDEMETMYANVTLGGDQATIYTNYAGKDIATYNANTAKNTKTKENAITTAMQLLADKGGYSSIDEMKKDKKMASSISAIQNGNFSSVSNTPAGKSVAQEYKAADLRATALRATMAEFKKLYPGLDPTKKGGAKYKVKDPETGKMVEMTAIDAFNKYLESSYLTTSDTKMTWEPTGATKKQMDNFAAQVINNGYHLNTPINLPAGFTITDPNGNRKNIGGTQVSINDLVKLGFVPVEQKEAGKTGGKSTPGGSVVGQVITYTDGVNKLNFTVGSTGVVPIMGANDSNNFEFGLKVNVNGEEVTGRINNISTDMVDQVMQGDAGRRMKATRFVNKLGPVEYTFPGGPTYYGKDVYNAQGKRIRKKGDIVYGSNVLNISDQDGQEVIARLIE